MKKLINAVDDVVTELSGYVNSNNELLQESAVAAITNQGSKLAAETLYKHTVEKGDADGYYSLGIGLGELIPDDETLPYLNELVSKRDKYSHLAVKALLNRRFRLMVPTLTSKSSESSYSARYFSAPKSNPHLTFSQ